MAGQSKDGQMKPDRSLREAKGKRKEEVAGALRRLTDEIAALRADLTAPVAPQTPKSAPTPLEQLGVEGEWTELLAVLHAAQTSDEPLRPSLDAVVARLGYAFASPPKVTLIRLLLENGEQPAARLGDEANLTTGSLYHHLRELIHAEVVTQETRNRYSLTPHGKRAALILFGLVQAE